MSVSSSNEMRVLHLIDTFGSGGAETVFSLLADKTRDANCTALAVLNGEGWLKEELERRQVEVIVIPAKGSFLFGFIKALVGLVRKRKITLIHAHLLGSSVYASIVGLISGVPVISTFHGMVDIEEEERFSSLKKLFLRWGTSATVSVSQVLEKEFVRRGYIKQSFSHVIYNGVDFSRYDPGRRAQASGDLDDSSIDTQFVIGCLGNIRPAKGYDVFVEAVIRFHKTQTQNVKFIVAGVDEMNSVPRLQSKLDEAGIPGAIEFIGFVSDTPEFLSQLDLFVLPSKSEGLSIVTIEAMAMGLPVLVTRCGGPEEIVVDGESGYFVEASSSEALADGMSLLLKDHKLRNKIAQAATLEVKEKFSMEKMVSSYAELYQKLS